MHHSDSPPHTGAAPPHQQRTRSPITTHVLDTAIGKPAEGVPVELFQLETSTGEWRMLGAGATNRDGR